MHPPSAGRSETSQKMGVGEGTVGQRCNGHPRTTLRLGSTVTLIGGRRFLATRRSMLVLARFEATKLQASHAARLHLP